MNATCTGLTDAYVAPGTLGALNQSVWPALATELVYRQSWPTRQQLEMEVFSYLEGFYNARRRHSRRGNLSPTDYETLHTTHNEVSA